MLNILKAAGIADDPEPDEDAPQLRQVLDALPAAVYATNASGRITYYNRAAAELAGRKPEIGRDEWCVTFRLFNQDGTALPHNECPMAVALQENRPVRGAEALAQRPDGSLFPFLPFPTPIHDEAGRLLGAVNMLVDISERKEAEANQRTLLMELNHRVKNNMQMLYSLLIAASREAYSEEARGVLVDASQRIAAMAAAQRLLYGEANPRSFRADELLRTICDGARQTSTNRIAIGVEAEPVHLSNDVAQPLALILNELLTNAIKYGISDRPDGEIRVALRRHSGNIVLSVQDDGAGFVPPETRRRASGLGLVRGLASQLNGRFAVIPSSGGNCVVSFPEICARASARPPG